MLRNLSLLVPFLLLVHVTSAVALSPCSGTPVSASICGLTEPNMPGEYKDGIQDEHGTTFWANGRVTNA